MILTHNPAIPQYKKSICIIPNHPPIAQQMKACTPPPPPPTIVPSQVFHLLSGCPPDPTPAPIPSGNGAASACHDSGGTGVSTSEVGGEEGGWASKYAHMLEFGHLQVSSQYHNMIHNSARPVTKNQSESVRYLVATRYGRNCRSTSTPTCAVAVARCLRMITLSSDSTHHYRS